MRETEKMQGSSKEVFQGFIVAPARVHQGVVDITPGESEVAQLNKGPQMLSTFLLLHIL